jgi:hypothetical protein
MKTLKGFLAMTGLILGMVVLVAVSIIFVNLLACVRGENYSNDVYTLVINLPWYVDAVVLGLIIYSCGYAKHNPGKLLEKLSKMLF